MEQYKYPNKLFLFKWLGTKAEYYTIAIESIANGIKILNDLWKYCYCIIWKKSIIQIMGYFKIYFMSFLCICFNIVRNVSNLVTILLQECTWCLFSIQCYNHFIDSIFYHCVKKTLWQDNWIVTKEICLSQGAKRPRATDAHIRTLEVIQHIQENSHY